MGKNFEILVRYLVVVNNNEKNLRNDGGIELQLFKFFTHQISVITQNNSSPPSQMKTFTCCFASLLRNVGIWKRSENGSS